MTLGDLIEAIKLGQKQPGKSAVLQKVAEVTKAPNWGVGTSTLQKPAMATVFFSQKTKQNY